MKRKTKTNTAHTQAELIPHPGFLDITEPQFLHPFRQGDVCLIPIPESDIPANTRKQHGLLLRRGENNGRHALKKDGETEIRRIGQQKFVRARKGATQIHGTHGEVSLPPGFYMMRVQEEASLVMHRERRYVED